MGETGKDNPSMPSAAETPVSRSPASAGEQLVLSNLSPSAAQKRLALGFVLVLLLGFAVAAGPLANFPLTRIDAFIPAYGTAILVNDTITAALLFAQFSILRSRALLALASGYLLTGLTTIPWALTFPGLFAPDGLLGAGLQSTAWLYLLWHAGFTLFVIAYALLRDAGQIGQGAIRAAVIASIGSVVALLCGVTVLVTAGDALMPRLMLDTVRLSGLWLYAVSPIVFLMVFALVLLWLRQRSVLDLWLMVVLCAYVIEIALISFPVPTRFSFGWYAGRVYGLLSGSLLLFILMNEITMLYGQLLSAVLAQRREREARLLTGDAISASIAHEVRQPLSAMLTNASAGLRWLDRAAPDVDEAKAALTRVVANGRHAGAVIENIRALFTKNAPNPTSLDVNDLIQEALAAVRGDLETHRIAIRADRNDGLPRITGDQVQLQQLLVNLLSNAIDAMASEGGERILRVKSQPDESGTVLVSVEDTGKGVEPGAIDRIFNPLFTTKAHGMGIGLSICRSIVEAHHGRLWAVPDRRKGAAFRFTLPAETTISPALAMAGNPATGNPDD